MLCTKSKNQKRTNNNDLLKCFKPIYGALLSLTQDAEASGILLKVFLNITQNSQKNTFAGVSFLA